MNSPQMSFIGSSLAAMVPLAAAALPPILAASPDPVSPELGGLGSRLVISNCFSEKLLLSGDRLSGMSPVGCRKKVCVRCPTDEERVVRRRVRACECFRERTNEWEMTRVKRTGGGVANRTTQ